MATPGTITLVHGKLHNIGTWNSDRHKGWYIRSAMIHTSLPRETDDGRTNPPSSMGRKWTMNGRRQTGLIGKYGIGGDNIGLIGIQ